MTINIRAIILVAIPLLLSCSLFGQVVINKGDNFAVNNKSLTELSEHFKNYTGIIFSTEELASLAKQVDKLDSLNHYIPLVGGYSILGSADLETTTLSNIPAGTAKYFAAGFTSKNTDGEGYDVFVNINNEDLSIDLNRTYSMFIKSQIEDFYDANMNRPNVLADGLAVGISQYILLISADKAEYTDVSNLYSETNGPSGQSNGFSIRSPELVLDEADILLSVSGVPLPLPAQTRVRFYPLGHENAGRVAAFRLKDDINLYEAQYWARHPNYEGDFSGYGYKNPVGYGETVQPVSTKYSYEEFIGFNNDPNYVCDYPPPYAYGDDVSVRIGLIENCGDKVMSKYFTRRLNYTVTVVDLSDPSVNPNYVNEGLTKYSCANKRPASGTNQAFMDSIFTNVENLIDIQSNLTPYLERLDFSKNFKCITDSVINLTAINIAIENGYVFVGKIQTAGDSLSVVVFTIEGRPVISYLPFDDSFSPEYLAWDYVNGWVPVDGAAWNPSQDIFELHLAIGKMLAMGAFVYISVAAGVAGGIAGEVFGVFLFGEGSAYATVATALGSGLFDIAFAGGEAYVMFYITDDEAAAWNTFKTGVVFAGIGTAGELVLKQGAKAFLAFKSGDGIVSGGRVGRNFDVLVKIQKESGEIVDVSMKNFVSRLEAIGWDEAKITSLLQDMNESGSFMRYLLLDPDKVRAWEQAFNRGVPDILRRNPDFLKPYSKALAERPKIGNHLKGHISPQGNAVGCHFPSAVDGVNVRLNPNQPSGFPTYFDPPANTKLKEGLVQVKDSNGNWVSKQQRSTFFPDSWDEDQVLEEIARLRADPSNKVNDRLWSGVATDGTPIEVRYTGADINNLTFSTIFPDY